MAQKKTLHFYLFALAATGNGLSGGDRIFIELAKNWTKDNILDLFVGHDGENMAKREGLREKQLTFHTYSLPFCRDIGFAAEYIAKIFLGLWIGMTLQIENNPYTVVYAASDFWMDSFPVLLLKARFTKITCIGTFYLTAPNPFRGFREKGSLQFPTLNGIIYFLQQWPILHLLQRYANIVFVTSQPDVKKFPKQMSHGDVMVIRGGVNMQNVAKWKQRIGKQPKKFDAVFMSRFHPQKGVLELIDIWRDIVQKRPEAKLVMIGDGPLFTEVVEKIHKYKLGQNIFVKGYLFDGEEKYKIFSQSKMVLHPVLYDSGGMSAAEAMAWGLPAISFDLEALKTYYPKGMLKVPIGDMKEFADTIYSLLNDHQLYLTISKDAKTLIKSQWEWKKRAQEAEGSIRRSITNNRG